MNFRNLIGAYIAFAKMNKQSHGYRPNKRQDCSELDLVRRIGHNAEKVSQIDGQMAGVLYSLCYQ
jgi:hypothetical protein